MDYHKHYSLLVNKALDREKPNCYTEKHHIIPKCMGGTDDSSNLVVLTAREHFIAHQLLAMMHPEVCGLALAVKLMTTSTKFNCRNNREFAWIRERAAIANGQINRGKKRAPRSKEWSRKISIALSGKTLSDETKSRISSAMKGVKKSDEMKKNMSIAAKTRSKEHQEKLNAANRGKKRAQETINKLIESNKLQPMVQCPHCGKIGKPRGMKCWHFDKCKEKK